MFGRMWTGRILRRPKLRDVERVHFLWSGKFIFGLDNLYSVCAALKVLQRSIFEKRGRIYGDHVAEGDRRKDSRVVSEA